ncbi:hypothetical protein PQX77_015789 [Marasmius sp. AFHP31]|nr:hypothetical protein PQX77_015789 [Marasmius sp. AFHP31]
MSGGSNIYGPQYNGPPGAQFKSDSQVGAIAALLGGLTVGGNNTSIEPPGTSDAGAGSEPRSQSLPIGAIVGGVIGGITLAGLVAACLWVIRRRAQLDHETAAQQEAPVPFLGTTSRPTGKHPPPPPGTSTVLGRSGASSKSGITGMPVGPMATTMEELVSAPNQHLGNERQWDPNELPPDYSTQIARGGTLERGNTTD